MDFIEPEEASDDGVVDDYGDILYEDNESGLGQAGARTGVTKAETIEVKEVQQAMKVASILSHMLKPPSFLTQGGKNNNKAQEKLFNNTRCSPQYFPRV